MKFNMLQELAQGAGIPNQQIKKSDTSDAGAKDVLSMFASGRVTPPSSLDSGSDVQNYLEKATDINDGIDCVAFGIDTSDGKIVKVYVNAEDADAFEQKMSDELGVDNDVEVVLNTLAQEFDIVDIVWPQDDMAEVDPYAPATNDGEVDIENADDMFGDDDEFSSELNVAKDEPEEPEEETPTDTASAENDPENSKEEPDEKPEDESETDDESKKDSEPSDDNEEEDEEDKPKKKLKALAKAAKGKVSDEEVKECLVQISEKGDVLFEQTLDISSARDVLNKLHPLLEATVTHNGEKMIGQKFLKRLNEQDDAVEDGFSIVLDTQYRNLVAQHKKPLERKIIAFYAMTGIPGRFISNIDGISDRISSASDILRSNISIRNAFDDFYSSLATVLGYTTQATVTENKRGNSAQKKYEAVLVKLGFPEILVDTDGPSQTSPMLYKVSRTIEENPDVEAALNALALRLGISSSNADNAHFGNEVFESFGDQHDDYVNSVIELAVSLGIPREVLELKTATVVKSVRQKKQTLVAKTVITNKIKALQDLLDVNDDTKRTYN